MISRENNFDIIRLIAALEVAIGHIFTHLKIEQDLDNILSLPCRGVIVFLLLAVS